MNHSLCASALFWAASFGLVGACSTNESSKPGGGAATSTGGEAGNFAASGTSGFGASDAGASGSGASSSGASGSLAGGAPVGDGGAVATGGAGGVPQVSIANDLVRLDSVTFGNAESETAHALGAAFFAVQATVAPLPSQPSSGSPSEVVTGALGESARRLLPRTPNGDYYGGEISFVMKVDPQRQNYFTAKFWGSEKSASWLILNVDDFEVGARHPYGDGSANEMIFGSSFGWLPNRFFYRTERIPKRLTAGKTSVRIRLRSLGELKYYAGGDYDNAQSRMTAPTAAVYRAYTHTGSFLDAAQEPQGAAPPFTKPAAPTLADEQAMLKGWRDKVNARIADRLAAAPGSLNSDDVQFLAEAYGVAWTSGYQQAAVLDCIVKSFDAMITAYAAAPATYLTQSFPANAGWGGYFGPIGEALSLVWPVPAASLNQTVAYGGSIGSTTRKSAWAQALRASIDFGRLNRKTITNQQMDAAWRVYAANRGLSLVDAASAFSEEEAKRYLYEAVGLQPFLGNDQAGAGAKPIYGTAPFGPNWFTVTTRGTSKEDGLVGGDYGERGAQVFGWYRRTKDPKLLAQAVKMLAVRAPLRHLVPDAAGHPVSFALEHVGCRNSQEVDSHLVYLGRGGAPDVAVAGAGVATVGADLVGYLQQQFNDGQLLSTLRGIPANYWSGAVYLPDDYQAFRKQPSTNVLLPMSPGQPDFAWADEENMVVAAKQGDERFWAVLNWRAALSINELARVYVETSTTSWLGEVGITEVKFNPSGKTSTESGNVEGFPAWTPPDKPMNAELGVMYPIALRPDLTRVPPTNRDGGRGTAYTLRYGKWLVAINAHPSEPYTMQLPAGLSSALDLVSGQPRSAPVVLSPKSAVVFHVDVVGVP